MKTTGQNIAVHLCSSQHIEIHNITSYCLDMLGI